MSDRASADFLTGLSGLAPEPLLGALRAIICTHPRAVVVTDENNRIVEVNPEFEKMTGYDRAEAIAKNPALNKSNKHPPEFYDRMWRQIETESHWEGEIWDRKKDGTIYPKWLTIDRLSDADGATLFYVAVFHELSEADDDEDAVDRLLYYDHLTGLPNRILFRHHLEHEFQVADRHKSKAGLMLVNIDRFGQINDGFGYRAGDDLIVDIARRMEDCIRRTDLLAQNYEQQERKPDSVSRFGGDEFSFILSDLKKGESAAIVAERVLADFEKPFEIEGEKIYLNASVGIAIYPDNGGTTSDLLRCAENALARSKRHGGNEYTFFSESMNRNTADRVRMEGALRRAVQGNEFDVYYQPKVDINTQVVKGMEALIRWPQDDGHIVMPTDFIGLSEETGQIVAMGAWVLRKACEDCLAFNVENGHYLKVAVNISAKQFRQTGFLDSVRTIVAETGIDPTFLELEITESMVMEDVERAIDVMKQLREIGITLAMDDFGTGYSSLAFLRRFPLDSLKIDRSFVTGMLDNSGDASIVAAICSIGRNLGLQVVAEGVENEFEVPVLQEMGCTTIQGFLYGKPMPMSEFTDRFAKTKKAVPLPV